MLRQGCEVLAEFILDELNVGCDFRVCPLAAQQRIAQRQRLAAQQRNQILLGRLLNQILRHA